MQRIILYIDQLDRTYRVIIAVLGAAVTFFCCRHINDLSIAALNSWITFCFIVLFFAWVTILAKHPKDIGVIASEQDENYWVLLLIFIIAAFASLFAIVYLLHRLPNGSNNNFDIQLFLSIVALFFSWSLIHTLFIFKYADLYYTPVLTDSTETKKYQEGLAFPGEELPDFLDFAYFSFTLGMTFQVSDINITNKKLRKLSLLHSVISYIFSVAIIAIGINIISGMIGK